MEIDQVARAIEENPDAKAVLVNNPTYYGICSDLRAIVKLAHSRGIKVLTDEAHGTHLYFGENLPGMSVWRRARACLPSPCTNPKKGKSYTKLHYFYGKAVKADHVRQIINLTQTTSASYLLFYRVLIFQEEILRCGVKQNINIMNSSMEKPYVVGIDIGGTNTVFGIVDARGTIIASGSIKTGAHDQADDYVDAVCKNLLPLIIANGGVDKIKGIGIGAPNGNYYSGTIEFAPNLPWKGVIPLAAMFEERLGIPTALTNDANAAAIGEMTYGAARGMKDFIMITLGTGVGSGIVINGQMVYGHDGFAGELGHVIIRRENGRLCGCGRHGCLETYCSATGVARTAREFLTARTEPSLLRSIPAENITSKDVYDAAVQGDKLAQDIFDFTGNILGEVENILCQFVTLNRCIVYVL